MHLIGLLSQDAPLLTTLSCENEHLLAVRVIYIFNLHVNDSHDVVKIRWLSLQLFII